MKPIYLVSACLVGLNTRYDGTSVLDLELMELMKEGRAIPVCPEQLGGLKTPRCPSEIQGGHGQDVLCGKARVFNNDGEDATDSFIKGAKEALKLAETVNAEGAILKARSPSCGVHFIYDGTFQSNLIPGSGVTAALLHQAGFKLFDENTWKDKSRKS